MLDPEFAPLLERFDLHRLDEQDATIYGIDRALTIRYVNAGWFRFAAENDAPAQLLEEHLILGVSILDFLAGPLREYYKSLFCHLFSLGAPRILEYECSSPWELRYYHMDILPLSVDSQTPQGLLLINSISRPAEPKESNNSPLTPKIDDYLTDGGFLISCSNCRRFRRRDQMDAWDWVPTFLKNPPAQVSHSLCSICIDYYYPAPRLGSPPYGEEENQE